MVFRCRSTLVHGVVERVFHTTISERGAVVGARFRPGGFAARFDRDAAALTGRVQPVDDELFGAPIHLDDDVDSASARLDELIAAAAGELDSTYVALTALVDRIRDDDRLHRVEQVMPHSPWSARTTQRVFRRYVGVPVKWVLCRYRLQQAALEIESDPGVDFADLAVRLGWYDQAHFINDFRTMLGCTPGEYAATARRVNRYAAAVDPRDLAFAGAAEQARMLAAGTITAPDLLEIYLDRIAPPRPRTAVVPRRARRLRPQAKPVPRRTG